MNKLEKQIDSLSIDCVIFGYRGSGLELLLVKHGTGPTQGQWALPGSWVYENESLEDGANRILFSQTCVKDVFLDQFRVYGAVDRFPNKRVITVAYYALVNSDKFNLKAGASMSKVKWFKISDVPQLPFDHDTIVSNCFDFLKQKVLNEPIGFNLLPAKFTLLELLSLYESILERSLDKSNFRKKFLKMNLLVDTSEVQQGVAHRAAKLYNFDSDIYNNLLKKGFSFEV